MPSCGIPPIHGQKKAPAKGWGISIHYRDRTEGGEGGLCRLDKDGLLLNHEVIMQLKHTFELYFLVKIKRLFELTGWKWNLFTVLIDIRLQLRLAPTGFCVKILKKT